jgi:hypothetical protein
MLLVACAVVFELCLAAWLWRVSTRRPSVVTEIASVFIGLAATFSLGLAAQGFFLLAVDVLQVSELAPTVFWLTSGALAFAVALSLNPSPASTSIPCILIGALSLIYSVVRHDEMAAVVGAVLILTRIALWSIRRPRTS